MRLVVALAVVTVAACSAGGEGPKRTESARSVERESCPTNAVTHSDPFRTRDAIDGATPAAAAEHYFAAVRGDGPAGDPKGPHAADFTFTVVDASSAFAQVKVGGLGGRPAAYFVVQHTGSKGWTVISEDDCEYGD